MPSSVRSRQVIGSSPIVGSRPCPDFHDAHRRLAFVRGRRTVASIPCLARGSLSCGFGAFSAERCTALGRERGDGALLSCGSRGPLDVVSSSVSLFRSCHMTSVCLDVLAFGRPFVGSAAARRSPSLAEPDGDGLLRRSAGLATADIQATGQSRRSIRNRSAVLR